ncbi:hypothetical protein Tco_1133295 [Tanacetum coccineum]
MHTANTRSGLLAVRYIRDPIMLRYLVWSTGVPERSSSSFVRSTIGVSTGIGRHLGESLKPEELDKVSYYARGGACFNRKSAFFDVDMMWPFWVNKAFRLVDIDFFFELAILRNAVFSPFDKLVCFCRPALTMNYPDLLQASNGERFLTI